MACERFADALRRHALGVPLRQDAAAHLAVCSACQALFQREERLAAMITTTLDEIADVRPAPEFVASLRASLNGPARWTPRPASPRRPWREGGRWSMPAAALALVLLAIGIGPLARAVFRTDRASGGAGIAMLHHTGVDRTLPPAFAPMTLRRDGSAFAPTTLRRGRPAVRQHVRPEVAPNAEVIVPASERRAVGRLFDALREGRPAVVSMLMKLNTANAPAPQTDDVIVPPLRIDSVVVPALSTVALLDK